ncbi:hypothetical protein RAK27_11720 [Carnobacterium maltaromaticum]|uniref:XkdX family protein n=1 Tax=Carnobacterium maltaromaticum TaxID=2751 RepID=A0AAW9K3L7_CARML|nr:hypothetical protein [Carnobacterium maltaromaticum]MDZ5759331.1 hypothetical protein [Carnobacterium maltaromaticum]
MSKNYEKWKERYLMNWCRLEQLEQLVNLKQLTKKEMETIVKVKENMDSELAE